MKFYRITLNGVMVATKIDGTNLQPQRQYLIKSKTVSKAIDIAIDCEHRWNKTPIENIVVVKSEVVDIRV